MHFSRKVFERLLFILSNVAFLWFRVRVAQNAGGRFPSSAFHNLVRLVLHDETVKLRGVRLLYLAWFFSSKTHQIDYQLQVGIPSPRESPWLQGNRQIGSWATEPLIVTVWGYSKTGHLCLMAYLNPNKQTKSSLEAVRQDTHCRIHSGFK